MEKNEIVDLLKKLINNIKEGEVIPSLITSHSKSFDGCVVKINGSCEGLVFFGDVYIINSNGEEAIK